MIVSRQIKMYSSRVSQFNNFYFLFQYTYDPHSYGVIQSTDHLGRTCTVKWFRTYTTGNEPQPLFVGTTLEPVYDLKDHPDFKYRPGSIVIRVANFNDMSDCTGGQVLDNYTSGQVLVWWANNSTSACWPQDLYKVNRFENLFKHKIFKKIALI